MSDEAKLLLDHPALSQPYDLSYNSVSSYLSWQLVIEGPGEDIDLSPFNQLLDHLERTCVASYVERCPVLAPSRLLEVEWLHLVLLQGLVDSKHPPDRVKAEALRSDMHVGPAGLHVCSQVSS